jgi:hypothetical protein
LLKVATRESCSIIPAACTVGIAAGRDDIFDTNLEAGITCDPLAAHVGVAGCNGEDHAVIPSTQFPDIRLLQIQHGNIILPPFWHRCPEARQGFRPKEILHSQSYPDTALYEYIKALERIIYHFGVVQGIL